MDQVRWNLSWRMESFLIPLDLAHVSVWERLHRKWLEKGGKTWNVMGWTDRHKTIQHTVKQAIVSDTVASTVFNWIEAKVNPGLSENVLFTLFSLPWTTQIMSPLWSFSRLPKSGLMKSTERIKTDCKCCLLDVFKVDVQDFRYSQLMCVRFVSQCQLDSVDRRPINCVCSAAHTVHVQLSNSNIK